MFRICTIFFLGKLLELCFPTRLKMAGHAPAPFAQIGQFVLYQGKTCLVTEVDPKLGFNSYTLLDIDVGKKIRAHHHQLEKGEVIDIDIFTKSQGSYVDLISGFFRTFSLQILH